MDRCPAGSTRVDGETQELVIGRHYGYFEVVGRMQGIVVRIAQYHLGVLHFEQRIDGTALPADSIARGEGAGLGTAGARSDGMGRYRLLRPVLRLAIDDDRRRQVVDAQVVVLRQREGIDLAAQEQAGPVVECGAHGPCRRDHPLLLHLQ